MAKKKRISGSDVTIAMIRQALLDSDGHIPDAAKELDIAASVLRKRARRDEAASLLVISRAFRCSPGRDKEFGEFPEPLIHAMTEVATLNNREYLLLTFADMLDAVLTSKEALTVGMMGRKTLTARLQASDDLLALAQWFRGLLDDHQRRNCEKLRESGSCRRQPRKPRKVVL